MTLLSETNKKPINLSQIITSSLSTKEDRSTSKRMAAPYPCIKCKQEVRPRQEVLLCDSCDEWQHRTCNSSITRNQYHQAVKDGADIEWQCSPCRLRQDVLHTFHSDILSTFEPPVDSTHLSDLPPPVSPLSDMDIDIDS